MKKRRGKPESDTETTAASPRSLATLVVALAVLASAWHMLAPPDWHWDAFSGGASLAQRRISDVLLQRSATVQREGNLTAATALLEQAVRANPQNDDAHFAIAQLAAQRGQLAKAITAVQTVTRYNPASESAWANLGTLYDAAGRRDEEYSALVEVARLRPSRIDTLLRLGDLSLTHYADAGRSAEYHARAERLEPSNNFLRMRNALVAPRVFASAEQLQSHRVALEEAARRAAESKVGSGRDGKLGQLSRALAYLDPTMLPSTHYLLYQGQTAIRDRALLTNVHTAANYAFPTLNTVAPHLSAIDAANTSVTFGRRLRVGFISRFWNRYAVAKLFSGVVVRLAAQRQHFDIVVFASEEENPNFELVDDTLAPTLDWLTVKPNVRIVRVPKSFTVTNRVLVEREKLDIAVFPSIGMDMSEMTWASARIAKIQVAAWTHPQTSGIQNIDYFIVGDAFVKRHRRRGGAEPETFSEQLVRFASLGFYFEGSDMPRTISEEAKTHTMHELIPSVPESATTYMLPQSLEKLHFNLDKVASELLALAPTSYLLIGASTLNTAWRQKLAARMRTALGETLMSRVLFLPRLSTFDFWRVMALADVIIDPFPVGGSINSIEALALCKAVVTMPARQTVLTVTAGLYHHMGLRELVTTSKRDFVETAHRLIINKRYRERVERDICDKNSVLFNAHDSVEEWAQFLKSVAGHQGGTSDTKLPQEPDTSEPLMHIEHLDPRKGLKGLYAARPGRGGRAMT